jgi:hypothetical protein
MISSGEMILLTPGDGTSGDEMLLVAGDEEADEEAAS